MFKSSTLHILRRITQAGCVVDPPKSTTPLVQFVRWRRRRWAPINRSKMYYVRTPTPRNVEETVELKQRTDNYNTALRALVRFFKDEQNAIADQAGSKSALAELEREFEVLLAENDAWNEETSKIRVARQSKLEAELEEKRIHDLLVVEQNKELEKRLAAETVRQEKESARQFVSMDNLEEEIEKALNTRMNYNFALDLDGNRYVELPDGSVEKREQADLYRVYSDEKTDKLSKEEHANV